MKKITLLFVAIVATCYCFAQNTLEVIDTGTISRVQWRDSVLRMNKANIPTGFLLEYSMFGLEGTRYDGINNNDDTIKDNGRIFELHSTLYHSKVNSNAAIDVTDTLFSKAYFAHRNSNVIPLTFIYQKYNVIRQSALSEGLFTIAADSVGILDAASQPVSPYNEQELFAFAPFKTSITRFNAIPFTLPNELFYMQGFTSVEVDFGDGAGYRLLNKGGGVNIYYATEGLKYLTAKITTTGGVRIAKCRIDYKRPSFFSQPDSSWTISTTPVFTDDEDYINNGAVPQSQPNNPALPPNSLINLFLQNQNPGARVTRDLGCDGVFDKPIIIVEGFDPTDDVGFEDLRRQFAQNEFIITMRAYGYDIVYVDFTKNQTYIENNARVLEQVINQVNQTKVGNHKSTVIGYSMGGLIARWCLKDMEDRNLTHNVENYFSYDAPHQGVNIPLGMQYFFNEMIYDMPYLYLNADLMRTYDASKSPAARQMIVTFASYNNGLLPLFPNLTTLDPIRNVFADRLLAKGYPQQTNNYGVALGRGNNTNGTKDAGNGLQFTPANPFGPQTEIFSASLNYLLIEMATSVRAVPENNTKATIAIYAFKGLTFRKIFGIPFATVALRLRFFNYTGQYPYDDAMGSFERTQEEFAFNWPLTIGGATTNGHNAHCFVPTASALDLQNQGYGSGTKWQSNNMFFNVDNLIQNIGQVGGNTLSTSSLSPFEAVITSTTENPFLVWNFWHNDNITFDAAQFIQRKILNTIPVNCAGTNGMCNATLSVTGPTTICTNGATYQLQGNTTGLTINWTIQNGTLAIVSGQGTNSITVNKLYDGAEVVKATVTNACGTNLVLTQNVTVGVPIIEFVNFTNGVTGEAHFCSSHIGNQFEVYFSNTPTNTSIQYRILSWPSLNVVYTDPNSYPTGSPITVYYTPTPEWYVLEVRATNDCGTGDWIGFEVEYKDCTERGGGEYFRVQTSPNPASSDINVTIDQEKPEVKALSASETIHYILYDFNKAKPVKQWKFLNNQKQYKLNIQGIKSGQYVLIVTKGKYRQTKQVIVQ